MKRIIRFFTPPDQWKLPVIILSGIFVGLGIFTLDISKAPSYLSDEPETCINCHVMTPMYQSWKHSSHREVANCNDCHVPHNNFANHYFFKAKDGLRHATIFTLRNEPQVIHIKDAGKEVVQQNCLRCHGELMATNQLEQYSQSHQHHRNDKKCWDCHRTTPHGRVNSLSSTPDAIAPLPDSPIPDWLEEALNMDNKK